MNTKPSNTGDANARADLHLTVHGLVQGVGYREGMLRVAVGLGIEGWVCNRFDGTVEAVVRGTEVACDALVLWSRRGPLAARVQHVHVRPASAEESASVRGGFRRLETR